MNSFSIAVGLLQCMSTWRTAVIYILLWYTTVVSFSLAAPLHRLQTCSQMRKLTHTEIDELVVARDKCRAVMDYARADEIKSLLEMHNIEVADISYKCVGVSKWKYKTEVVQDVHTNVMALAHDSYELITTSFQSADEIASKVKDALRLQLFRGGGESTEGTDNHAYVEPVVVLRSTEMQGRKYADAAFEFSMAGIADRELFELLADCSVEELKRFGLRRSCQPIHIVQLVEKLAAAGVREHPVYSTANGILQKKYEDSSGRIKWRLDSVQDYNLFSGRVLMWLWRYATKQTKPTKKSIAAEDGSDRNSNTFSSNGDLHISNIDESTVGPSAGTEPPLPAFQSLFADPSLPLVLDLGCGYGVSILNLCDQCAQQQGGRKLNFLGVDLSNRAIGYAAGITARWGYSSHCAFLYCDCVRMLQHIHDTYPGPVSFVMLNFPTPYGISAVLRQPPIVDVVQAAPVTVAEEAETFVEDCDLQGSTLDIDTTASRVGNGQLPDSFDTFMCNTELVSLVQAVLRAKRCADMGPQALLLQSNVEDVVVTMRNIVQHVSAAGATASSSPGFYMPDDVDALDEAVRGIFSDQQGDTSIAAEKPLRWRSEDELVASTDVTRGGGRMSRRLETWLADLLAEQQSNAAGSAHADSCKIAGSSMEVTAAVKLAGRSRAFGHGWLARSPLPGNARTETEVHCEVEKQPVHRTMFLFE